MPREAAEAIVEGLNESDLSELATKADVKADIAEVKGEIGALRAEMRAGFVDLRADLYGRLWVMGLGIVGLNVALMRLLP